MCKRTLQVLAVALWAGTAWGQAFQNNDMFVSAGPAWSQGHAVAGTSVVLQDSRGYSYQLDYGYQLARMSAASLMIDLSFIYASPGGQAANVKATGANHLNPLTLGLRFMVPVHPRLSFYAVTGGGYGTFRSPSVSGGDNPTVSSYSSIHGVFAFGGGSDLRLSRLVSLRAEVRDIVSGRELAGAAGRHHVLPFFGFALHF